MLFYKKALQLGVICAIVGLVATPVLADNLTLILNANDYKVVKSDDGQQVIKMEDFGSLLVPGKPTLPAKVFMIALPPGAEVMSVTVTGMGPMELPETYRIRPAPPVLPMDDEKELVAELMHEWRDNKDATYSSDQIYPGEVGEYLGTGGLRKYTFARVHFCPFAYRPVSGKLLFYPSATVSIYYILPSPGSPEALEVERLLWDVKGEDQASRWLVNYSEIRSWYTLTAKRTAPQTTYDYIIITTEDLKSSVSSLVNWKQAIGYSVNVATTSWISSSYSGFDLAEKIRNFLIDKYPEWGIEYVLLVGDIDVVPMRECYPKANEPESRKLTDHYYADLSGDWNSDGDDYYGEYGEDDVDPYPEVYVGRIPWNDVTTVANICQKIVNFEADIGQWKNRALLLGAVLWYENNCNKGVDRICACGSMESTITDILSGWTYHTMYEKEGLSPCTTACTAPLNHTNVIDYWSTGQYGIVSWGMHGGSSSSSRRIWAWDDGDGIPENSYCPPSEMSHEVVIHKDDAISLDDTHPSIIFAGSCSNGDPEKENLARELLKHGSVSIVAGTGHVGDVANPTADTWGHPSNNYYFYHYLINEDEKVGKALFDSKLYMLNHYVWGRYKDYWNMYAFCLYGDPALIREGVKVYPDIQLSSASHNFGEVPVGGFQDWTLTISNVDVGNLLIDAIEFNHPDFDIKEIPGGYAYVADGSSGLQIVNISNPATPSPTGSFNTPGSAYDVIIVGDYAYVADSYSGLQIIDLSDLTSPFLVGSYDTPHYAKDVSVVGDYAYVADGESGLLILDIKNPASPFLIGSYDTPSSASGVAVVGDYAYVTDNQPAVLQILDISDPTSPSLTGSYSTWHRFYDVAVVGDYAYVANHFSGLCIINISNPASPSLAGGYNTPGYSQDVAVVGDYAYVADYDGGLQIINVSNPASPSLAGSYDTPGNALCVTVAGDYAYVADEYSGLQIIDVSDPTSPSMTGSYQTPDQAKGVAVAGSFPQTVLSGGHLNVTVAFTPSSMGTISGQLTVYSDDPDESTLTVSVTGKGVAPDMRITPAMLDETLMEGEAIKAVLTISNQGNYELTYQITEAIDWLEVDPSSGTVTPDNNQSIEVTIDATSLSQGDYEEEITIECNDPFNQNVTIPISLRVEAIRVIIGLHTTSVLTGETAFVPVDMDNLSWLAIPIASIDAEIGFDENLLEFIDVTPSERTQSMSTFEWSTPGPGIITLTIGDATGKVIETGTGPVAEISFAVSETATSGDCTMISILEAVLTDDGGNSVAVEPIGGVICFGKRGDVNADGEVNILDALLAVNILLDIITPTDLENWATDCNGDGVVNVMDVLGIVNVVLGIGECGPGACKSQVTDVTMEFLKSLEPHFAAKDFTRLMALVKGMQAQVEIEVPTQYSLAQNYPNPFNPTTSIQYSVVSDQTTHHSPLVTLKIYNLLGQEVRILVDEVKEPGYYTVTWDGKDSDGRQAVSGIYFYQLSVNGGRWSETKRMVLMK